MTIASAAQTAVAELGASDPAVRVHRAGMMAGTAAPATMVSRGVRIHRSTISADEPVIDRSDALEVVDGAVIGAESDPV